MIELTEGLTYANIKSNIQRSCREAMKTEYYLSQFELLGTIISYDFLEEIL